MSKFDVYFDRLIGHEGGYVNHPQDKGGETIWGITKATAREYGYTGSMKNMSRETAKRIYYKGFWCRYQCDQFPDALAWQFFDCAVNHGFGNACRMLQRALKVADDGIIGSITLAAIKRQPETQILLLLNAERLMFYTKLSTFKTFGKGWVRRVAENLSYAWYDLSENA